MRRLIASFVISALVVMSAAMFAGCARTTATGTDESASKSYTIARISGKPDWESVPIADIDVFPWPAYKADIIAHAQLCYDDEAFYVRMWAQEADIRAEYQKTDLMPNTFEDSCLELFIMPVENDARYMNFEINPNCAMAGEIGTTKTDRVKLVSMADSFEATSVRIDNGWEVRYKIPFSYIKAFYPDFTQTSGTQMRGNFYKCGNLTKHEHFIVWNQVESEQPNFHVPNNFGALVLA
jgi:hypothetical protein